MPKFLKYLSPIVHYFELLNAVLMCENISEELKSIRISGNWRENPRVACKKPSNRNGVENPRVCFHCKRQSLYKSGLSSAQASLFLRTPPTSTLTIIINGKCERSGKGMEFMCKNSWIWRNRIRQAKGPCNWAELCNLPKSVFKFYQNKRKPEILFQG